MIFRKYLNILLGVLTAVALTACDNDPESEPGPVPPEHPEKDGGTVLVYMVANNDLGQRGWDQKDIDEMAAGMSAVKTANPSHLLVYHAASGKAPELKEVCSDGTVATLKSYDGEAPSVSIARMREVIADAQAVDSLAPLRGMVFWSHATGWLEESSAYEDPDFDGVRPLSFGYDSGRRMSIPALAQALDGTELDFIYFDCCLMGTVEVVYELRHAAAKIAAVATELPLEGMPYDRNLPHFFSGKADAMESAAKATYDYYCSAEASNNSVAMVVTRTSGLDRLAELSRAVMETGAVVTDDYKGVPFFRPSVTVTGSYDMHHYYTELRADEDWRKAYNNTVTYYAATPKSYGLDMAQFKGLGTNVFSAAGDRRLGYGYKQLAWWRDVVSHHPYFN